MNYIQNFIQHPAVKVIPYAEEIIEDHQCGFRRNRSTTAHIFLIHQIFATKKGGGEYSEILHQLLMFY